MPEAAAAADHVCSRQRAAQLPQGVIGRQFRSPSALTGKQRKAEALPVEQALPVMLKGRDHGKVGLGQFLRESVFLPDRSVAPATWPVELGHQWCRLFDPDSVDPVLVTVQRQDMPVALVAE